MSHQFDTHDTEAAEMLHRFAGVLWLLVQINMNEQHLSLYFSPAQSKASQHTRLACQVLTALLHTHSECLAQKCWRRESGMRVSNLLPFGNIPTARISKLPFKQKLMKSCYKLIS